MDRVRMQSMQPMQFQKPLTIEQIRISPGVLSACVRVRSDACHTNARIAQRVVRDHPDLPRHSCVNARGPIFASVIQDTSTPHLLEHVVIDRQVREEPNTSEAVFAGHTEWISKEDGSAAVTVRFRSDACALRALSYACAYLNAVLEEEIAAHD